MSTPIYDGLIRDRKGLGPGGLTDATLRELAEHRASLALPPPMEFPAPEPEPVVVPLPEPEPVIEVKPLQEKDAEPEPEPEEPEPEEPEPAEAVTQVIPVVPADETQEIDQSELVVK
jgi:hypothetical protein